MPPHPAFLSCVLRLQIRDWYLCRCDAVAARAFRPAGSVEAYLKFLRSGGSKFPLETLKAAGVDMTTSAPIESTLQLFERRLGELEALLL